ncbi:conserved domain protein, partial [Staphylococcus aureus subsp. aureus 21235]
MVANAPTAKEPLINKLKGGLKEYSWLLMHQQQR